MRRGYVISGRVQAVGFRQFAATQARLLGLSGWVRNLPDGCVAAEAQGSAELLAEFEAALQRGPQISRVDAVETRELPDRHEAAGFVVLR